MRSSSTILSALLLCGTSSAAAVAVAAPSPSPTAAARIQDRELVGAVGDLSEDAISDLSSVLSEISAGELSGTAGWSSIKSALLPVTATTTQTNAASAISALSSIYSAAPSINIFEFVASLVAEGLTEKSVTDALDYVDGLLTGEASLNNTYLSPIPRDRHDTETNV